MTGSEQIATPAARSVEGGPAPLSTAGASYLAVLIALAVVAIGAVGLRDGVIAAGWTGGVPWTPAAVDWLAHLRPGRWMLPVGGTLAVVGLAVTVTALVPRRKPALELVASTAVYVDVSDVARIASVAAESVAGVITARSSARRGAIVVTCDVTGSLSSEQRRAVESAVSGALAALRTTPKIVVRTKVVAAR